MYAFNSTVWIKAADDTNYDPVALAVSPVPTSYNVDLRYVLATTTDGQIAVYLAESINGNQQAAITALPSRGLPASAFALGAPTSLSFRADGTRVYAVTGSRQVVYVLNIDQTYGKEPLAFGPDTVGLHPASRSPFGVDDMAGNVWEWTASALVPGETVVRGGSFYHDQNSSHSENREVPEASIRDLTVGLRVCASVLR